MHHKKMENGFIIRYNYKTYILDKIWRYLTMKKTEVINEIRNKIFGNIKNKEWFKNYKHETILTESNVIISGLTTLLLCIIYIIAFGPVEQESFFLYMILSCLMFFGIFGLLATIIGKFINKRFKREVYSFIKESENMENEEMTNLINENKIFSGSEFFVNFIKSQSLDKEDLETLRSLLSKNFNEEELNCINYNEELNKELKITGNINYNYVFNMLNLLEVNERNKHNKMAIDNIKACLFGKIEGKSDYQETEKNNFKKETATI